MKEMPVSTKKRWSSQHTRDYGLQPYRKILLKSRTSSQGWFWKQTSLIACLYQAPTVKSGVGSHTAAVQNKSRTSCQRKLWIHTPAVKNIAEAKSISEVILKLSKNDIA